MKDMFQRFTKIATSVYLTSDEARCNAGETLKHIFHEEITHNWRLGFYKLYLGTKFTNWMLQFMLSRYFVI